MADVRFCSSRGSKMDIRDQFCINCESGKKSTKNKKETEKATTNTKSLKWVSFRKETGEKKKSKVTRKTITADRRKSMFSGNCKTVDSSVVIKVAIMDTSKESLEPRGFKLPVKVGKDMTADEVRVLAQKKHSDYNQFFSELENNVLRYSDTKLVCHKPGTDESFTVAKYKKELGKPYSKIWFYLHKDEEYQSSLLKGFTDSVSQIYLFLWRISCIYAQIL